MLLQHWCRVCKVQLTTLTARKRKESPSGYRNHCKECHNADARSKAKPKRCEYCKKIDSSLKGLRYFCSMFCRFNSYYKITSKGCWEWLSVKDRDGYGIFVIGKKRFRAHRISYELFKNKIENDLYVCHACDNPSCVNHAHLWLGTNAENQQDRFKKKIVV